MPLKLANSILFYSNSIFPSYTKSVTVIADNIVTEIYK